MTLTDVTNEIPDLNDPQTFAEAVPYDAFAALRARDGLYWQPTQSPGYPGPGFWVATRREDILAIENDSETFTCVDGIVGNMMGDQAAMSPGNVGSIMFLDPPNHSRLRRVVSKSLAPRVVANFEGWVREVVTQTLDEAVAMGEFDFVADVGALIPSRTIAKVVGVPRDLAPSIVKWTNELFTVTVTEDWARAAALMQMIEDLLDDVRIIKLDDPADDIISFLAPFERDGVISNDEYRSTCRTFVNAGFETTHTTISQTVRMMIENPQIAARVSEVMESHGADPIADEFIRLITPVMAFMRTATRDTEIAGTPIKAGDVVSQWYPSANRDPETFANPDEFDPLRDNVLDHMAFGAGVHRCIGAPLAKLQVRVLLEELHSRGLKFEMSGEPRRGWSAFINQSVYVPVRVIAGS